jgi:geranylgeranyl reductase family protein
VTHFDVIVVGAGPAGSTVAKYIAKAGFKTLIIEDSKIPRDKLCAGLLPPRIIDLIDVPQEIIERPIHGYRFFSPSSIKAEAPFPDGFKGFIISRKKFDYHLTSMAAEAGAEILDGNGVVDILFKNECAVGVKVRGGEEYFGTIIVGADGVNSVLKEKVGLPGWRKSDVALAMQCEVKVGEKSIDDNIGNWFEIYYNMKFAPGGYGWIAPQKTKILIGIGIPLNKIGEQVQNYFENFLNDRNVKSKIGFNKPRSMNSHLIPFSGLIDKLYVARVLFIGDAGGFVQPGTGEGIYHAIQSGLLAGKTIVEALTSEDLSENRFQRFEVECAEYFRELMLAGLEYRHSVLYSNDTMEAHVRRLEILSKIFKKQ